MRLGEGGDGACSVLLNSPKSHQGTQLITDHDAMHTLLPGLPGINTQHGTQHTRVLNGGANLCGRASVAEDSMHADT